MARFRTFSVDDDGGGCGGDRAGGSDGGVCDGDLRLCMTDCNLDHESRLGARWGADVHGNGTGRGVMDTCSRSYRLVAGAPYSSTARVSRWRRSEGGRVGGGGSGSEMVVAAVVIVSKRGCGAGYDINICHTYTSH